MKGTHCIWFSSRLDVLESDGKDGMCALGALARRRGIGRITQDVRCRAHDLVRWADESTKGFGGTAYAYDGKNQVRRTISVDRHGRGIDKMGTSEIVGMGRGVGDVRWKEAIGEHLVHGPQQGDTRALGTLACRRGVARWAYGHA